MAVFGTGARLTISSGSLAGRLERFSRAEQALGEAALRLSAPYLPRDTGELASSGEAPGDGQLRWAAPHAAVQYYQGKNGPWFERMKAAHRRELVEAAAKAAGGHAR